MLTDSRVQRQSVVVSVSQLDPNARALSYMAKRAIKESSQNLRVFENCEVSEEAVVRADVLEAIKPGSSDRSVIVVYRSAPLGSVWLTLGEGSTLDLGPALVREWMPAWTWDEQPPPADLEVVYASGQVSRVEIAIPNVLLAAPDQAAAQSLLVTALAEHLRTLCGASLPIARLDDAFDAFEVTTTKALNCEISRRIGLPLGWRMEFVDLDDGTASSGVYLNVPGVGAEGRLDYPTSIAEVLALALANAEDIGSEQFVDPKYTGPWWGSPRSSLLSEVGRPNRPQLDTDLFSFASALFGLQDADEESLTRLVCAVQSMLGTSDLLGMLITAAEDELQVLEDDYHEDEIDADLESMLNEVSAMVSQLNRLARRVE